ncbi:hypothetical protein [Neisseria polysaccharea]|uniref:hypothetical protein n=1 Tax=Neisseria polysaccharea TaxID=489 RepID=UPI0027E1BE1F|nr:hypothetical protein [Neisseria polysaccharea]
MTVATTYPGMTAKGLQTASATVGWASAHQSTSKNEKNGGLKPTLPFFPKPALPLFTHPYIVATAYSGMTDNGLQTASGGISCLPLKQFAAQLFKHVRYISTHRTTHKAPPYVSS